MIHPRNWRVTIRGVLSAPAEPWNFNPRMAIMSSWNLCSSRGWSPLALLLVAASCNGKDKDTTTTTTTEDGDADTDSDTDTDADADADTNANTGYRAARGVLRLVRYDHSSGR